MIIPQAQWDLLINKYNEVATDMIDSYFGADCKLYFGSTKSQCSNCNYNPISQKSSNTYRTGGPIPFEGTICPYCDGEGFLYLEATETIKLRVYFDKRKWVKIAAPAMINDNAIQTIGHIADMSKCISAKHAVMNVNISGIVQYKFILAGEPSPYGLDKKFFIAYWNRYNG